MKLERVEIRDSRDSKSSRDSSRRGYKSHSDSGSEDDRYRSRSRGRSGKPCTYCHKPNHDFSHCYKLARELRKFCTGDIDSSLKTVKQFLPGIT